jgi:tetratricopeptide (TPR) repeat protein
MTLLASPLRLAGVPRSIDKQATDKKMIAIMACGLWLVTVLLFLPARGFGFVSYDDGPYVYDNDMVKQGLNAGTLKWAFLETHFFMWHPLTSLSHLLDVTLFGLNPSAFHLENVLLHAVSAVLLFLFLLRTTQARWPSLFVALLFAWHPLRVESVAWIAERKDVLSTLFWLLTLHAYVYYTEVKTRTAYWFAVIVYALGILTKPTIVTLPCVLLLIDVWPLRRFQFESTGINWAKLKPLILEKLPFFALCVLLSVITYKVQKEGDVLAMMESTTLMDRLGNACVSYVRYIGKLLWPLDLAVLYPYPGTWPLVIVLAALVALVAGSWICWKQRMARPWLLVGWLWFLGVLVPAIGIVQAGGQAMADRYTYVSTIGLLIILVWTVVELDRIPVWGRYLTSGLACVSLAGSLVLTSRQLQLWGSSEALFRHTAKVTKNNAIAHFSLAFALLEKERIDEAITEFFTGLDINPRDHKGWYQLGRAYTKKGDTQKAANAFLECAKLMPSFSDAHFQLSMAYTKLGKLKEAELELIQYLKDQPRQENAWNNLGNIQFLQKNVANAATSYLKAAELAPDRFDTWMNLANLFLEQQQFAQGLNYFERALKLKPDDAPLWYQYGSLCEQFKQPAKAVAAWRKALILQPEMIEVRLRLAWRLAVEPDVQVRNGKEALMLIEKLVAQTGATGGPMVEILAAAKAEQGSYDEAVFWAESALKSYENRQDAAGVARLKAHLGQYRQKQPWRSEGSP